MEAVIHKILDELNKAHHEQLESAIQNLKKENKPYQSAEIKELSAALAKAQGEYNGISFNRTNPYFKSGYADLHEMMKSVRAALAKNGLSFIQQTQIDENGITMLHSRLMHASGQWIESRNRVVPPKNDIQTYGSTLSYQKRYAAQSLLGITVSADPADDDGEVAQIEAREIVAKGPSNKYNPKDQSFETITKEQLEELEYELAQYPDLAEHILDKLQLQSLSDMPKSKYMSAIQRIREIKIARESVNKK